MSGSTTSSENSPVSKGASSSWVAAVVRAGAEGALAAVAAGAVAGAVFPQRRLIVLGLALAWAACTVGTACLAFGSRLGPAWFWRAFGLGAALRGAVLVALVAVVWRKPLDEATALLGAYVGGLIAIILLESRHLVKDLGGRSPGGAPTAAPIVKTNGGLDQ